MGTIDCNTPEIIEIANLLCELEDKRLNELCLLLCNEFKKIKICRVEEIEPGSGPGQFDPINEDIFDPISEDIFDPEERFYPEGIPLRAISEQIYDSYGNRIHPSESIEMILSLLSWIIRWEDFKEEGYPDCNGETPVGTVN